MDDLAEEIAVSTVNRAPPPTSLNYALKESLSDVCRGFRVTNVSSTLGLYRQAEAQRHFLTGSFSSPTIDSRFWLGYLMYNRSEWLKALPSQELIQDSIARMNLYNNLCHKVMSYPWYELGSGLDQEAILWYNAKLWTERFINWIARAVCRRHVDHEGASKLGIKWECARRVKLWKKGKFQVLQTPLGRMAVSSECFTLDSRAGLVCGHYHELVSVTDCLISHGTVEITYALAVNTPDETDLPPLGVWRPIRHALFAVLALRGNDAYKLLKQWESWHTAVALSDPDEPVDNTKYIEATIQGYQDVCTELDVDWLPKSPLDFFNTYSRSQLIESYGLHRIFSHPLVDTRAGMTKLKKLGRVPLVTSPDHIFEVTSHAIIAMLKRGEGPQDFLWPRIRRWSIRQTGELERAFTTNMKPLTHVADFDHATTHLIKWRKRFDIPTQTSLSDILADRALSPDYNHLLLSMNKGNFIRSYGPSHDRRVIIDFLKNDMPDLPQFLDEYTKGEPLEEIFKLIGLVPKERELKVEGRSFAENTAPVRSATTASELLLAQMVVKHMKCITMTSSREEVIKLNFRFARKMLSELHYTQDYTRGDALDTIAAVIGIDFEKWNTRMRGALVYWLGVVLDQWFDLPGLYAGAHDLLEQTWMYIMDGYTELFNSDQTKIPSAWMHHHLGGIEGLRQKLWTILTVGLLESVMCKETYKYEIIGQGDNQNILVERTIHEQALHNLNSRKAVRAEFFASQPYLIDEISKAGAKCGIPIKQAETFSSGIFFNYGKEIAVEGVFYNFVTKPILRSGFTTGDALPSFTSYIGALTASFHSAMAKQTRTCLLYGIYTLFLQSTLASLYHYYPASIESPHKMLDSELRVPYPAELKDPTCRTWIYDGTPNNPMKNMKQMDILKLTLNRDSLQAWSPDFISLMFMDASWGGWPIKSLYSFATRETSDPSTTALANLKALYESGALGEELTERLLCIADVPIQATIDIMQLIQAPESLNICKRPDANTALRELTKKLLTGSTLVHNERIKQCLRVETTDKNDMVALYKIMSPKYPAILYEIWSCTQMKVAEAFVAKVESTGTIKNLLFRQYGDIVCSYIEGSAWKMAFSIFTRLSGRNTARGKRYLEKCSLETCTDICDLSWDCKDSHYWKVPAPFEVYDFNPATKPAGNSILVTIPGRDYEARKSYAGCHPPYLGAATRNTLTSEKYLEIKRIGSSFSNLSNAASMMGPIIPKHSPIHNFFHELVSTWTDANPCILDVRSFHTTGHVSHRHKNAIVDKGAWGNYNQSLTSHFMMNANYIKKKGSQNDAVHLQKVFVAVIFEALSQWSVNNIITTQLYYCAKCPGCHRPLPDFKLQQETLGYLIRPRKPEVRPYGYVPRGILESNIVATPLYDAVPGIPPSYLCLSATAGFMFDATSFTVAYGGRLQFEIASELNLQVYVRTIVLKELAKQVLRAYQDSSQTNISCKLTIAFKALRNLVDVCRHLSASVVHCFGQRFVASFLSQQDKYLPRSKQATYGEMAKVFHAAICKELKGWIQGQKWQMPDLYLPPTSNVSSEDAKLYLGYHLLSRIGSSWKVNPTTKADIRMHNERFNRLLNAMTHPPPKTKFLTLAIDVNGMAKSLRPKALPEVLDLTALSTQLNAIVGLGWNSTLIPNRVTVTPSSQIAQLDFNFRQDFPPPTDKPLLDDLSRALGVTTSSYAKVMFYLKTLPNRCNFVALADGSGGIALTASILGPERKIGFRSLNMMDELVENAEVNGYSDVLLTLIEDKLIEDKNERSTIIKGDITDRDEMKSLVIACNRTGLPTYFTMDAEQGTREFNPELTNKLITACAEFMRDTSARSALLKMYASSRECVSYWTSMMNQYWRFYTVYRSDSSGFTNTEVYVLVELKYLLEEPSNPLLTRDETVTAITQLPTKKALPTVIACRNPFFSMSTVRLIFDQFETSLMCIIHSISKRYLPVPSLTINYENFLKGEVEQVGSMFEAHGKVTTGSIHPGLEYFIRVLQHRCIGLLMADPSGDTLSQLMINPGHLHVALYETSDIRRIWVTIGKPPPKIRQTMGKTSLNKNKRTKWNRVLYRSWPMQGVEVKSAIHRAALLVRHRHQAKTPSPFPQKAKAKFIMVEAEPIDMQPVDPTKPKCPLAALTSHSALGTVLPLIPQ
jgi:hypothetical protein